MWISRPGEQTFRPQSPRSTGVERLVESVQRLPVSVNRTAESCFPTAEFVGRSGGSVNRVGLSCEHDRESCYCIARSGDLIAKFAVDTFLSKDRASELNFAGVGFVFRRARS